MHADQNMWKEKRSILELMTPPPHTHYLNVTCKAKKRNDERVLDLAVQTTARTENLIETENSTYM